MATSSCIGQSIKSARNHMSEHPRAALYPNAAASTVVEDGFTVGLRLTRSRPIACSRLGTGAL